MITTVVITRPSGPYAGAEKLSRRIAERGLRPFEFPVLVCEAIALGAQDLAHVAEALATKGSWIAFLSPTAVHVFADLITREFPESATLPTAYIAAQGTGTAAAVRECCKRSADFIPSVFVAEEFAKELAPKIRAGQLVLVPQSAEGRDLFAPTLRTLGKQARSFSLYGLNARAVEVERCEALKAMSGEQTVVVFMSPSAVRAAVQAASDALVGKRILSVGPITTQAIRKAGLSLWREAREHSEDGVLEALSS
jgi:uroporphyrinogen III methyltransferase/synthase